MCLMTRRKKPRTKPLGASPIRLAVSVMKQNPSCLFDLVSCGSGKNGLVSRQLAGGRGGEAFNAIGDPITHLTPSSVRAQARQRGVSMERLRRITRGYSQADSIPTAARYLSATRIGLNVGYAAGWSGGWIL
jgi:hypothetical protein